MDATVNRQTFYTGERSTMGRLMDKFERSLQGAEFDPLDFRRTMEDAIARGLATKPEPRLSTVPQRDPRACDYCGKQFIPTHGNKKNCSLKCQFHGKYKRHLERQATK